MDQPFPPTPSSSSLQNEFRIQMLIKFNSGLNREDKGLCKIVSVQIPRPLRILESGEIRPLFSFRKAVFYPSPLFATALQLLQRHNNCNSERSLLFLLLSNSDSKFFRCYRRNYCCCCVSFWFFCQNGRF